MRHSNPTLNAKTLGGHEHTWGKMFKKHLINRFHFRLFHQTLTTNVSFSSNGFKEDASYAFCHSEPEDLPHMLWFCKMNECFLKNIISLLKA